MHSMSIDDSQGPGGTLAPLTRLSKGDYKRRVTYGLRWDEMSCEYRLLDQQLNGSQYGIELRSHGRINEDRCRSYHSAALDGYLQWMYMRRLFGSWFDD